MHRGAGDSFAHDVMIFAEKPFVTDTDISGFAGLVRSARRPLKGTDAEAGVMLDDMLTFCKQSMRLMAS